MKYRVRVDDREVEVDLTGSTPRVNGRKVRAELRAVPGNSVYSLLVDGRSTTLRAQPGAERGIWRVDIEGMPVVVEALDERTRTIRELTGGGDAPAAKVIAAPMPGMIVRINVEVGQAIPAGHGVIVVEAMKMENELRAPAEGTVARIDVRIGQAVEKGAVLVVLE